MQGETHFLPRLTAGHLILPTMKQFFRKQPLSDQCESPTPREISLGEEVSGHRGDPENSPAVADIFGPEREANTWRHKLFITRHSADSASELVRVAS